MSFTILLLIVSVFAFVLYDIFTLWKNGPTSTISYVIINVSKKYPIIPFAVGVLMGHLFWQL